MPLCLFNTRTKTVEDFVPLEEGKVRMYTCGPTVYDRPHIGNYASFLMADLLRRWLEVSGFTVHHVKNITDVGHLVADSTADAGGEDKIEKKAREEKIDPLAIAQKYTDQYLEDEKALNMLEPHERPRATETIPEMISLIGILMEKGNAYETDDGVYFSVQSFPEYGTLSGNTLDKLGKLQTSPRLRMAGQEGVRVALKESKKHPADFALWKKRVGEHKDHILHWDSPWEDGFPGWHIECSAMSLKYLCGNGEWGMGNGEYMIDIHTGGEDNIFPHHECEIAQTEAAFGQPFVRYWLHKRRVNFANEKMSKSLGNVLTVPEIVEKGFDPLDLRFFFLSSHYRSHTQFTWKGMEDARKARLKIGEWMTEVKESEESEDSGECALHMSRFMDAMNQDLNTPEALSVVFELMAWSRKGKGKGERGKGLRKFCVILEHTFGCFLSQSFEIPVEIQKLAEEREAVRRAGDYAKSDQLRDALLKRGFVIEDLEGRPRIVPKDHRS
jgi:cysteinyl-tRNA synthetase